MRSFCENNRELCRFTIKILIILSVAEKIQCQDFGYDGDKGPSHWGEQYNTCFGKHQSPINIDSLDVVPVNLPPLEFIGFDEQPAKTNLTNNGHTVMLELDADPQPAIAGGPLTGVYEFAQLHFHWGDNDTVGSEDLIDSHSYAMELHLVFYKSVYRNSRAALDYEDGLAVLAFFFEVTSMDNPDFTDFTTLLSDIRSPHRSTSFVNPPKLRQLIGQDLIHYYTYNGSLTTPPCSEVVVWIDFKEPISLSHDQLEKFRALEDTDGARLTHNYRPIQPLGDRIVLFNTEDVIENNLQNRNGPAYAVVPAEEPVAKPTELENEKIPDVPDQQEITEPSNTVDTEKPQSEKKGVKRKFRKNTAWRNSPNSCFTVAISLIIVLFIRFSANQFF
ncbi:carbonic anhydrase [Sergentomyia squamirostris]